MPWPAIPLFRGACKSCRTRMAPDSGQTRLAAERGTNAHDCRSRAFPCPCAQVAMPSPVTRCLSMRIARVGNNHPVRSRAARHALPPPPWPPPRRRPAGARSSRRRRSALPRTLRREPGRADPGLVVVSVVRGPDVVARAARRHVTLPGHPLAAIHLRPPGGRPAGLREQVCAAVPAVGVGVINVLMPRIRRPETSLAVTSTKTRSIGPSRHRSAGIGPPHVQHGGPDAWSVTEEPPSPAHTTQPERSPPQVSRTG